MPLLNIVHRTEYRYATAVAPGLHRLMLCPRETRELRLLSFHLIVQPAATVTWAHDLAGNSIATASFLELTDTIAVESRMTVDLGAQAWPVFKIAASAQQYPFRHLDEDWTDHGALAHPQYVDLAGRLSDWVEAFVMGRPTDTLSMLQDVAGGVTNRISH
jgi:hypothetical protein